MKGSRIDYALCISVLWHRLYSYYKDHVPPHFHAIYGEDEVVIEIATGKVMAGSIPKRARNW